MAQALNMATPQGFDWAGIAALLGVAGAGFKYLFDNWGSKNADRDARIEAREERYTSKVEGRLREMDARLGQIERAYGLVVGVAHVMVDDLIVRNPQSTALAIVAARIREEYPVREEVPSEMLHLLHRLDTHAAKER